MFIGHFAVGFALKKVEPRLSLGLWFFAALFLDFLWPIFLLLGIEKAGIVAGITSFQPLNLEVVGWSHSLLLSLIWSLFFGLLVWLKHKTVRTFLFSSLAVFSHWLLDYFTHRPDLPLIPGSGTKLGLGLWNSIPGTLIVELFLFFAGIFIYTRTFNHFSSKAKVHLSLICIFLLLVYLLSAFGPLPPDDQKILAISALALTPIIAWAAYMDRQQKTYLRLNK